VSTKSDAQLLLAARTDAHAFRELGAGPQHFVRPGGASAITTQTQTQPASLLDRGVLTGALPV
jgi:hypothetical protein